MWASPGWPDHSLNFLPSTRSRIHNAAEQRFPPKYYALVSNTTSWWWGVSNYTEKEHSQKIVHFCPITWTIWKPSITPTWSLHFSNGGPLSKNVWIKNLPTRWSSYNSDNQQYVPKTFFSVNKDETIKRIQPILQCPHPTYAEQIYTSRDLQWLKMCPGAFEAIQSEMREAKKCCWVFF